MKDVNTYKNSAAFYDLDQRDIVSDDLPFYEAYASLTGGQVLELGCGTGRVAIHLAKLGKEITGLDLSGSMLNIFKEKLALQPTEVQNRISLANGNMADFSFNTRFGLIIAPFRAFQALTRDSNINGCLQCVYRSLAETGIFIVNVFRPNRKLDHSWCYPETLQWERFDASTGNTVRKKHCGKKIDVYRQIIYPSFHYGVTLATGSTQSFKDNLALKYYYYEQLKDLLAFHRLSVIEEYGWYDKSPIQNGRELIFVCKKQG